MGQSGSAPPERYNEEELLRQLAEIDPDFAYHDYVDGNCTLQEVISIRQCFLDLRDDYEAFVQRWRARTLESSAN